METILNDARIGVRIRIRRPGLATVAVLALALGIGANTTMFSVVNATLLQPLPFPDPDRLATVWKGRIDNPKNLNIVSMPNYRDWKAQNHVFEDAGDWRPHGARRAGERRAAPGDRPLHVLDAPRRGGGRRRVVRPVAVSPRAAVRRDANRSHRPWRRLAGAGRRGARRQLCAGAAGDASRSGVGASPRLTARLAGSGRPLAQGTRHLFRPGQPDYNPNVPLRFHVGGAAPRLVASGLPPSRGNAQ